MNQPRRQRTQVHRKSGYVTTLSCLARWSLNMPKITMSSPVEAKLSPSSDAKSLEAIMLCPNKPPSILCLRTESLIFRVIICGLGLYVIQPMEIYKELDVDGSKFISPNMRRPVVTRRSPMMVRTCSGDESIGLGNPDCNSSAPFRQMPDTCPYTYGGPFSIRSSSPTYC